MRILGQFYQLLCAYFGLMPVGCFVDLLSGAFQTAHVFPRLAKQIVASGVVPPITAAHASLLSGGVDCPNPRAVCVQDGREQPFRGPRRSKMPNNAATTAVTLSIEPMRDFAD